MSRQDFISRLTASLRDRVPAAQVEENARYYEEYIASQVRGGRSEHEVVESLGDPRLIAKSIVQASGGGGRAEDASYRTCEDGGASAHEAAGPRRTFPFFGISWQKLLLAAGVLALVMVLFFTILSLLLPALPILLLVILLVKLFRDWLN